MPQTTEAPAAANSGGELGLPRVLRDAEGWWAITLLVLGRETGMLEGILRAPATAAALAARCKLDARNAGAWLVAMTAHGYLTHENGTFAMRPSEASAFGGDAIPLDFMAILDFSRRAPALMAPVADAIRSGGGVPPAVFHDTLGDAAARISVPLYNALLLDDWLAKAGVAEDLQRGIDVAELACGTGAALIELAARCPASRFTGLDLDAPAMRAAEQAAASRRLSNVRFSAADAAALAETFDLVLVLDAFHHFGQPQAVLQSIARALRPGGRLVMGESTASGDVDTDVASPFARIVTSANLLYCLQEGLHGGGAGLGATMGADAITSLLMQNGFRDVSEYVTGTGYTVFTASMSR
jgi:SAM-dependent methyltransferase